MKPTIYLDMDGVLADFDRRYEELFGIDSRKLKDITITNDTRWDQVVLDNHFQTFDVLPGAIGLVANVIQAGYNVEICTSVGGSKHKDKVREDKTIWLKKQGLDFLKVNFVISGRYKGDYVRTPLDILIDDTQKCIDSFNTAGGNGILYTGLDDCLSNLTDILLRNLNESTTS